MVGRTKLKLKKHGQRSGLGVDLGMQPKNIYEGLGLRSYSGPVTGTNGNLQVCLPKVLGYPWGTLDGSFWGLPGQRLWKAFSFVLEPFLGTHLAIGSGRHFLLKIIDN